MGLPQMRLQTVHVSCVTLSLGGQWDIVGLFPMGSWRALSPFLLHERGASSLQGPETKTLSPGLPSHFHYVF